MPDNVVNKIFQHSYKYERAYTPPAFCRASDRLSRAPRRKAPRLTLLAFAFFGNIFCFFVSRFFTPKIFWDLSQSNVGDLCDNTPTIVTFHFGHRIQKSKPTQLSNQLISTSHSGKIHIVISHLWSIRKFSKSQQIHYRKSFFSHYKMHQSAQHPFSKMQINIPTWVLPKSIKKWFYISKVTEYSVLYKENLVAIVKLLAVFPGISQLVHFASGRFSLAYRH